MTEHPNVRIFHYIQAYPAVNAATIAEALGIDVEQLLPRLLFLAKGPLIGVVGYDANGEALYSSLQT